MHDTGLLEEIDIVHPPIMHYNSEQQPINLPTIMGCLKRIALRTRPDAQWATSRATSLITQSDIAFLRETH